MKISTILIVIAVLLSFAVLSLHTRATPRAAASQADSSAPGFMQTLIEPASSVGPLKLGDSEEHALELFPKKDEDQRWEDSCGTTLDWIDATNPTGRGDLFIRLKKDKVFQIESATTRFHTAEGITTFDPPEKVARVYKDLRAYTLLTPPLSSLGDRPLVFWIDKKKGIAFTFAYYPDQHKRYLYKITVFGSNKTFCPEQETMNSPKWQSIPSYSLEPPPEMAPNRE